MQQVLDWLQFTFDPTNPPPEWVPIVLAGTITALVVSILFGSLIAWRRHSVLQDRIARLAEDRQAADARLSERLQAQESALALAVERRLAASSDRMATTLDRTGAAYSKGLQKLAERLGRIDQAQGRLTELSGQISVLQAALSDKQARGAYGEVRLYDLVRDALPPGAYQEQATLSNGRRPDCLITLPSPPGSIAIDAKFPLEAFLSIRAATDAQTESAARRAFARDISKHIKDISERYILPGETADCAMLFVPSEAVYGELHANFRNVVETGFSARVYIVSPTTLWATLNTARAIMKDAQFHAEANRLQAEVSALLGDVGRLATRAKAFKRHLAQAESDIDGVEISMHAIEKRGARIADMDLGAADTSQDKLEAKDSAALS